ncbi:MAG: ABC transporter ATP-binding protein [Candidatus Omnitrophota bacterium]
MNAIEFKNVSKKFKKGEQFDSLRDFIPSLIKGMFGKKDAELHGKEFWAVKDVSFELKKGETLGIIGPNGAGKSTILKMLSRILKPTMGELKINGKLSALLEAGAGFHPDLTGRENVYLSGAIIGMKKKDIDKKFDSIVAFSELGDFIDTPVKRYSSGMHVRLGFAVAAHMDPEILLIDEVLAVGDMTFQSKCIEKVRNLVDKGVTIIFISHDLSAVSGICKKTIVLCSGQIHFAGDTKKAIFEYKEAINSKRGKPKSFNDDNAMSINTDKPVEIENVLFFDKSGHSRQEFATGETVVVRMEFNAKRTIKNPVFGIAITRSDGVYVYGPNTHIDEYVVDEISGRGMVELEYSPINLLAGDYFVSAGIFTKGGLAAYDFHDKKYIFSIDGSRDEQGIIFLKHEWRLHEKNVIQNQL